MAREHPNAEIARRLWEATARGDSEPLLELYAPDVVLRSYGDHPLSGELEGRRALLDYLARTGEMVDDLRSELLGIYAGEQGAVVHYRATATRGERQLDAEFLLRLRIDSGRVSEMVVVPVHQQLNDAFWRDEPPPAAGRRRGAPAAAWARRRPGAPPG